MMFFCIDFWAILAPFWDPSWGHVGDFFGSGGEGACEDPPSSLLRWCFLSIFSPPGPMGYPILGPHLGSLLEVFGLILAPCWG